MRNLICTLFVVLCIAPLAGCVGTVPLAPGADKVKFTKNQSDIASCKVMGNIDSHIAGSTPDQYYAQMQNQAIGLGGNVVFDTTVVGTGASGVIYRCE